MKEQCQKWSARAAAQGGSGAGGGGNRWRSWQQPEGGDTRQAAAEVSLQGSREGLIINRGLQRSRG